MNAQPHMHHFCLQLDVYIHMHTHTRRHYIPAHVPLLLAAQAFSAPQPRARMKDLTLTLSHSLQQPFLMSVI